MAKKESTREAILRYIRQNGAMTGPALAELLGITRQAVSLQIRKLLADEEIVKTGTTRAARYHPKNTAIAARRFKRDYALQGLEEAVVYENLALALNLSQLRHNISSIVQYAFTEMLNNAIDHSMSESCAVEFGLDAAKVVFNVRDNGIGVFHSIAEKFALEDEQSAMIELVKGKTTTQPQAHSGEGIFFVSRSADRFRLRSHRLQIEWNRDKNDVFVSDTRFLKGTLIQFELRKDSRTRLSQVFAEFAPEKYDYQFAKTQVLVKLLQRDYVSRSEAKRLLHNLERFSEIDLDMREVMYVGQGFADEVFRVFASRHPEIVIRPRNAGKAVAAMIRHVSSGMESQ